VLIFLLESKPLDTSAAKLYHDGAQSRSSSSSWLSQCSPVARPALELLITALRLLLAQCCDFGLKSKIIEGLGCVAAALAAATATERRDVIEDVLRYTQVQSSCMRIAVARCISVLATSKVTGAKTAMVRLLKEASEEEEVILAMEAMVRFSEIGDECIIGALSSKLHANTWAIRKAGIEAISSIAEVGSSRTLDILRQVAVDDPHRWVRGAAIDSISKLSWRGDSKSLQLMSQCLSDEIWCVRVAALHAVAQIAEKGDRVVLVTVLTFLEDSYPSVRSAALETLAVMAPSGDRDVISLVVTRLIKDPDSDVRREAIEALIQIAETGDANAKEILELQARDDEDPEVRAAAESAVDML